MAFALFQKSHWAAGLEAQEDQPEADVASDTESSDSSSSSSSSTSDSSASLHLDVAAGELDPAEEVVPMDLGEDGGEPSAVEPEHDDLAVAVAEEATPPEPVQAWTKEGLVKILQKPKAEGRLKEAVQHLRTVQQAGGTVKGKRLPSDFNAMLSDVMLEVI